MNGNRFFHITAQSGVGVEKVAETKSSNKASKAF